MSEGEESKVITDHPRGDEVDEIWRNLRALRPESVEANELKIVDVEFPFPFCVSWNLHVPAPFLEDRDQDQIAFGLCYATNLDPMKHYLDDTIDFAKDKLNAVEDSVFMPPLAALLGVSGALVGIWRGVTQFPAREREAIQTAVDWVHRAGFDPNQGVKLFMSLSGWFEEHVTKPADPDFLEKLQATASAAIWAPLAGAMSVPLSKDPPMVTAVDRAAAVRAACVARGFHR